MTLIVSRSFFVFFTSAARSWSIACPNVSSKSIVWFKDWHQGTNLQHSQKSSQDFRIFWYEKVDRKLDFYGLPVLIIYNISI